MTGIKPKKNKIPIAVTLLVIALLIINIGATAIIFLDIQLIKSPETTIKIDVVELNPADALIKTSLSIKNPNQFSIIVKNLKIKTLAPDGTEIAHIAVKGGEILSEGIRNFSSDASIRFQNQSPDILTTEISGTIGIGFIGVIKKTMPLKLSVVTSIKDVMEELAAPQLKIKIDIDEITNDGIGATGYIEVTNPNSFDMTTNSLSISVETNEGENIGSLTVATGIIPAKKTVKFDTEGFIEMNGLNAEYLIMKASGEAAILAAGINKAVDLAAEIHIETPKLEDIFSLNIPTDVTIKSNVKASLTGLVSDMTLEVINPNTIAIDAKDITFSFYRVDNDIKTLIGQGIVEQEIIKPENTTTIETQITIPYTKLIGPNGGGGLFPDWIFVQVRANATIEGLNQYFWIGVSGYQDLHILT